MLLRNLGEVYKKGLLSMSDLYKRIDSLCQSENISITTMCKESGASRASLSDLKVGRKQRLSMGTLTKIANFFGITADYFLDNPPFDCWELINANRKGFLSYVPVAGDTLATIWGIDTKNPDAAKDRAFISFLSTVVTHAFPTEEGDWFVAIRPEYAATFTQDPRNTKQDSVRVDILDEVDIAFYGDYRELNEENKETLRAMARLFRERQGKQE